MTHWITGLFDDLLEAREAVESYAEYGGAGKIGIVVNNVADRIGSAPHADGMVLDDVESMVVRGIGPVLANGPIAKRLGQAGRADLAEVLITMGVARERAEVCAEAVRRGCILVVLPVAATDVHEVTWSLEEHGALDMEPRVTVWKQYGWAGWDGRVDAMTLADIQREHDFWHGIPNENPYENRTRDINAQLDANRERMSVRDLEKVAVQAWFVEEPFDAEAPANIGNWAAEPQRKAS